METEITKLSSVVIDQIAAGEVVERPANMIKELVENAIDAGADLVEIEIEEGGRTVVVKDNGKGIAETELALALDRHATSKIREATDLWKIQSFGFRGEALASIAAVSELQLVSRTKKSDSAFRLLSEFGEKNPVEPVGGGLGTIVSVRNLFDNVPARKKFLKSESGEIGQIKQCLKALALAHWDVAFKLKVRGKLTFYWPIETSFLKRAEQVLGQSQLYHCKGEYEGFTAEIAFSPPHQTFGTSRNIWLFAQNRWIQDRSIQAAVQDAYRGLLMHGEFPYAVVSLGCDPDVIDVNIHPTKSQVKFQNQKAAFRVVQRTLREALEKAPWVRDLLGGSTREDDKENPQAEFAPKPMQGKEKVQSAIENFSLKFREPEMERSQYAKKSFSQDSSSVAAENYENKTPSFGKVSDQVQAPYTGITSQEVVPRESSKTGQWGQLQVLCQANNTYIVAQSADKIMFVDQHAAHERIAYESLMQQWQQGGIEVQAYLLPLEVQMAEHHAEALINYMDELKKLAVEIESGGPNTILVNSAPNILKEKGIAKTLEKMAEEVFEKGDSFAFERFVGDLCATMACHSVVRAGQVLSHEEMQALLDGMDRFPLSTFCPHGRPVFVEYPFAKLERDFGRIV